MKLSTIIWCNLLLSLIATPVISYAQQEVNAGETSKTLKFGTGYVFLGSGDMVGFRVENELFFRFNFEKKFNKRTNYRLINSVSMNFGHANQNGFGQSTVAHLDYNTWFSLFKNPQRHNVMLGLGYSLIYISEVRDLGQSYDGSGQLLNVQETDTRFTWGGVGIVGYEYYFRERSSIGLKATIHCFHDYDIIHGLTFQYGIRL